MGEIVRLPKAVGESQNLLSCEYFFRASRKEHQRTRLVALYRQAKVLARTTHLR